MKKKMWIWIMAVLLAVLCAAAASADTAPAVTIQLNGSSAAQQDVTVNGRSRVIVQAPGATGVRIMDPNRWDPEQNPNYDTADCWDYFGKEFWPLGWLEHYIVPNDGARTLVAEARYDDYEDFWSWEEENTNPWTGKSQVITLNPTSSQPNAELSTPEVRLSSASVQRGGWLTAEITNPQNKGEWYCAELNRQTGNNQFEWVEHFDFNQFHTLAIDTGVYEAGNYELTIIAIAPDYMEHKREVKSFAITGSGSNEAYLKVNKTTAVVGEEIFFSARVPGANGIRVSFTRAGDPGWFQSWQWGGESNYTESWSPDLPGTFELALLSENGQNVLQTETVTFTLESGGGQLDKPNLYSLPVTVNKGQAFSGTFSVDPNTEWVGVTVEYVPNQGEWTTIYRTNREKGDAGFNSVSVPAGQISQPGTYRICVDTNAAGYARNDAATVFRVLESGGGSGNAPVLTVNGQTANISSWPSSRGLTIKAAAEGATAIRLKINDDREMIADRPGPAVQWNEGFGDGDYTIYAETTTAKPVWREENFDWSNFRWDDLAWTGVSNAVKVHVVSSQGNLAAPGVTLKVGSTTLNDQGAEVTRGQVLTVTAARQTNLPDSVETWIWADVATLIDEGDSRRLENIQDGHFDSAGSDPMCLMIPTAGIPAGSYYLNVGVDAEDYNGQVVIIPLTVTEPAEGVQPGIAFSSESMLANQGITIYAWAPGADHMKMEITWDRDGNWRDDRGSGRDGEQWGWGCGAGGNYTFTLLYWMPGENTPGSVTKTLNVISEGTLDQPVFSGVPELLNYGEGINGSFQAIEEAEWYNVGLRYSPNGWDWEEKPLINEDVNPAYENATRLTFDASWFDREGVYQIWVSANAVGKDNGYHEQQIQVIDMGNVSEDLVLRVNGETDGTQVEAYLHQELQTTVSAPENVTGIRAKSTTSDWFYLIPDENGYAECYPGVHQGGNVIFIAQATTDASVRTWASQHGGNMDGFDWDGVTWSMTAQPVTVNVIDFGLLKPPVIEYKNGNSVERGNSFEFYLTPGDKNADYFGVRVHRENANGSISDVLADLDFNTNQKMLIQIPTSAFTAGSYQLRIDPRRFGWHGDEAVYKFTVTDTSAQTGPVFTADSTDIQTQERVIFSLYVPGAEEVRIYNENNESEQNLWFQRYGESLVMRTNPLNWEKTYHIAAYARYSGSETWEKVGNTISINVTAPNGALALNAEAPASISADQDALIRLSCDFKNTTGYTACYVEQEDFGIDAVLIQEASADNGFTAVYAVMAGSLAPGEYTIYAYAFPDEPGYELGYEEKAITVTSTAPVQTLSVQKTEAAVLEDIPAEIRVPGATAVALFDGYGWYYQEGEVLTENLVFWDHGTYAVSGKYTTAAIHPEQAGFDWEGVAWTGVTNDVLIRVTRPRHELEEVECTVSGTSTTGSGIPTVIWGEMLTVRISNTNAGLNASYGAHLVPAGEEFSDLDWFGPIEDGKTIYVRTQGAVPGDYDLIVSANAVDCYGKARTVRVRVQDRSQGNMTTLNLPSGLTTISEEAFSGVPAQRIIVPAGVKTIESRAFAHCPNLLVLELPAGITSFARDALEGTGPIVVYGSENSYLAGYAAQVDRLKLVPTD